MKRIFTSTILILLINFCATAQEGIGLIKYQSLDNNLDQLAEFPGGIEGLSDYFKDYFIDFSESVTQAITGNIEVQFIVNGAEGRVVLRMLYSKKSTRQPDDFSTAALFAVNDMPNWTPAIKDGYKVHSNHLITLGIGKAVEVQRKDETKVKITLKERRYDEQTRPSNSEVIEIPNDPILIGMEIPEEEVQEEELDTDFIYRIVDDAPRYPGGKDALNEYIKTKIVNTIRINNPDLTGKIIAEFIINKSGNIEDILMVRSLCKPCGKLTKKQLESMPTWKAARIKGQKVNVKYSLLILI